MKWHRAQGVHREGGHGGVGWGGGAGKLRGESQQLALFLLLFFFFFLLAHCNCGLPSFSFVQPDFIFNWTPSPFRWRLARIYRWHRVLSFHFAVVEFPTAKISSLISFFFWYLSPQIVSSFKKKIQLWSWDVLYSCRATRVHSFTESFHQWRSSPMFEVNCSLRC